MNPKGNIFNTLCARVPDKDKASELLVAPCFLPNFLAGPYWVLATGSDKDGGRPWEVRTCVISHALSKNQPLVLMPDQARRSYRKPSLNPSICPSICP